MELEVKMYEETAMTKLMQGYCVKRNLNVNCLKFVFEGERVVATDTPKSLGIADGDTVEVFAEQQGG